MKLDPLSTNSMQLSDLQAICSEANLRAACLHLGKKFKVLRNPNFVDAQVEKARKRLSSPNFRLRKTVLKRIPKGDGTERPIHGFEINDRVVFRAVHQVLWPRLEPDIVAAIAFCTYKAGGYHPLRGVALAHKSVSEARKTGQLYVLKTDIKGFYNKISRSQMLVILSQLLGASDATRLIPALLDVPIPMQADLSLDERELMQDGLPQGSSTSPLFACLYLREFDLWLAGLEVPAIRYVDDLVIMFPSLTACLVAKEEIQSRLNDLALDLNHNPQKTRIVAPHKDLCFLGSRVTPNGHIRPTMESWARLDNKIRAVAKKIGAESDDESARCSAKVVASWMNARRHYHFTVRDYRKIRTFISDAYMGPFIDERRNLKICNAVWSYLHSAIGHNQKALRCLQMVSRELL